MELRLALNSKFAKCGHHLLIILLSFSAGYTVVMLRTAYTWAYLKDKPFFYNSLIGSSAIAFILIHYIRFITASLNKKQNGFYITKARVIRQFFGGVLLAAMLAVLLASLLYFLEHESIMSGVYFRKLFTVILLFIVVINFTYAFYHLWASRPEPIVFYVEQPAQKVKIKYKTLTVKPRRRPAKTVIQNVKEAPALVYTQQKTPLAIDARGDYIAWQLNLKKSLLLLPPKDYFRINKSTIIHRYFVKEIVKHDNNLMIIPVANVTFKLIIGRRRASNFNKWFDGSTEPADSDP